MAPPIASLIPKGLNRGPLKAAEWMAENAFIPPGAHRILTAGGLSIGLWGGREFMDIVVARRNSDGSEITRDQVPEIFRPIHGLMRYNPYSDAAADRWMSVIDKLSPMALGALGAWAGSKIYIHDMREHPFHPASKNVLMGMKQNPPKAFLATADAAANIAQGDAIRRLASPLFAIGSSAGTHIFGGLFPFTNSMSAQTFMQSIGRKLWYPGLGPVNRFFGNRGSGGRHVYGAMRDAARWVEANVTKFDKAEHWATNEELLKRAKDALQVFRRNTPEQEQAVADNLRKLIDEAYAHRGKPGLYHFITNGTGAQGAHGLFDIGYENLLKSSGLPLDKAALGDNGPFSVFSRLIGGAKEEKKVWKSYAEHLNRHHGFTLDAEQYAASKVRIDPRHAALAYGGSALSIGGALAVGGMAAHRMNRRFDHLTEEEKQQAGVAGISTQVKAAPQAKKEQHGGNMLDWVNGKPLDAMQWLSRVAINAPSMHRFMSAAYLSLALWGGMKFANILTGRNLQLIKSGDLSKSLTTVENIWKPLRPILGPLHGSMAYTPGSALFQDRWRQAAHFIIPVAVGTLGTFTGSHMFFADRVKKLEKPNTLEDYADKISLEQSKFYAGLTAFTSIFNTGSGIHLLPIVNYSSNLHNRYLLASGQQVAMPGLGKWWSGNAGLTPWGVKRSLQYMTNYLAGNPEARPREFASLVHSVIGKLYPDLPEAEMLARKQALMNRLYEVRDRYLTDEGTVPASKREELKTTMHDMLSGKGFEETLLAAGLDPLKANLASNGVSGAISNRFGSQHTVEKLQAEYRGTFAERLANHKPRTTAEIIAEHSKTQPAGNDNAPAPANDNSGRTHAQRVTAKEQPNPTLGA